MDIVGCVQKNQATVRIPKVASHLEQRDQAKVLLHVRGKHQLNDRSPQNVLVLSCQVFHIVQGGAGQAKAAGPRHMVVLIGAGIIVQDGQAVSRFDEEVVVDALVVVIVDACCSHHSLSLPDGA